MPTTTKQSPAARLFRPPEANTDFQSWGDYGRALAFRKAELTMETGDGASGGYAVPEGLWHELFDAMYDSDAIWPRCRVLPMPGGNKRLWGFDGQSAAGGTLYGGVQVQWVGEGDTPTPQDFELRTVSMRAHKLMVSTRVSNELLADGGAGFERTLREQMITAASWALDRAVVRGTGAGMPLGLLNAPCAITVGVSETQANGTFTVNNALNMWARLHPSCQKNAVWLISHQVWPQIAREFAPFTTGYVPVQSESGTRLVTDEPKLMDRPVIITEHMNPLAELGDVALVDMSKVALAMRDRIGVQSSSHSQFSSDLTEFKLMLRCDAQPLMSEPYVPANGDESQSMIVLLGDRQA